MITTNKLDELRRARATRTTSSSSKSARSLPSLPLTPPTAPGLGHYGCLLKLLQPLDPEQGDVTNFLYILRVFYFLELHTYTFKLPLSLASPLFFPDRREMAQLSTQPEHRKHHVVFSGGSFRPSTKSHQSAIKETKRCHQQPASYRYFAQDKAVSIAL